jgi:hypothetical protein
MNVQFLIDSIVRQTTVLIAQLATTGGIRAPLAHIANQVFLDLAAELETQGVSRKVSADMFGMALRTYLRKIQRLSESSTERGRSLWESVLDYLSRGELVTRADVLKRFHRDDEAIVRGVLKDLVDSGLVFASGSGENAVYRAASSEELGRMRSASTGLGLEELVWAVVYRDGPISRGGLLKRGGLSAAELAAVLDRLTADGRVEEIASPEGDVLRARELFVPLGAAAGWEAAVYDHYHAMVRTVCARLNQKTEPPNTRDATGGSTYTFEVWEGHPHAEAVRGLLRTFRDRVQALRREVEDHNRQAGVPETHTAVVVYFGQSAIEQNS